MNQQIDALITAAIAHATANNMTHEQAIALASVRLVKRFCNQEARAESSTLPIVIQRLTNRHGGLLQAEDAARKTVLEANTAAVQAAITTTNVPE